MKTTNENNISSIIHLSALTQYLFPFGNYIVPIIIWSAKKNESTTIDYNGKQVLNFQLSILLYTFLLFLIAIPVFLYVVFSNLTINDMFNNNEVLFNDPSFENFTGFILLGFAAIAAFGFLKIMEFVLIIYASVKASNGIQYKYPLTINFLK